MCIGSRCYTNDHVVQGFAREVYFGSSRVCGGLRLKIGGSLTVNEGTRSFLKCFADWIEPIGVR